MQYFMYHEQPEQIEIETKLEPIEQLGNDNDHPNENNNQIYHDPQLQHLLAELAKLHEKIEKIAAENEQLKEKVENIKPINIENINYKIQELSVEELSGTLNIGMTALTDPENITKLMNEQEPIKFNDLDTEQFEEMDDFDTTND